VEGFIDVGGGVGGFERFSLRQAEADQAGGIRRVPGICCFMNTPKSIKARPKLALLTQSRKLAAVDGGEWEAF